MSGMRGAARFLVVLCFLLSAMTSVQGTLRRCIKCRSRGDSGSCKDPFLMNATQIEKEPGVETVPCASGWCVKIIESSNLNNDYGTATDRSCLQRGPDDGEERCAYTTWHNKKVFMCMCTGDLCNGSPKIDTSIVLFLTSLTVVSMLSRILTRS